VHGWLAAGLVVFLSVAGCAAKSDTTTTSHVTSHTTTATAPVNATLAANVTAPVNHAPTANLTATHGNGTAALNVTFALQGSDVDGDNLTWMLSFGDNATARNGTMLPAMVNHTYLAGGLLNVTLSVSDGQTTTVALLALNLTATHVPAAPPLVLSGHLTASDPLADQGTGCFIAIFTLLPGVPGEGGQVYDVPAVYQGGTFATAPPGIEADFIDSGSNTVGSGSSGATPATAVQVFVCANDPGVVDTDYTLTLTAP